MDNKYSEWIIIPQDRKCDLPTGAKVQVMLFDETVYKAERRAAKFVSYSLDYATGLWDDSIFAYRVVREPVTEVREYLCGATSFKKSPPSFFLDFNEAVQGIATETTRDGKPYKFIWRVKE